MSMVALAFLEVQTTDRIVDIIGAPNWRRGVPGPQGGSRTRTEDVIECRPNAGVAAGWAE